MKVKFKKLSAKAKAAAVFDYWEGQYETHEREDFIPFEDCWDICETDLADYLYDRRGNLMDTGEDFE